MDNWVTLSENLFSLKFMVFRSGLACHAVITSVGGVRVRGPLELWRVSSCFFWTPDRWCLTNEVRSSAGQWKKKLDDRQKRPGPQTRSPKTN